VLDGDHAASVVTAGASGYPPKGDAAPTKVDAGGDFGRVFRVGAASYAWLR
jgi:hypothetical protein